MISIVICSINKHFLSQVQLNIAETIGIEYEIIAIDNKGKNTGICEVYNNGAQKARFPILCFLHEDVLFETKNWGSLIIHHFNDPAIGLLGVAGGDTKGIVPSTWSTSLHSNEINIIQYNKKDINDTKHVFATNLPLNENKKRVTTLDGVFLCTKKEIFEEFVFDENNLKGFHGYDIDYSLQVSTKYKVMVIFDVLIHHYSSGTPDRTWLESTFIINKKWKEYLPISIHPLTESDFNFYHWKSLQIFLEHLFRLKYNYLQIIFYYLKYSFCRYFSVRRFLSMGKYVLLNMLPIKNKTSTSYSQSISMNKVKFN